MTPHAAHLLLALTAGVLAPGCRAQDREQPPLQAFSDSVLIARRLPATPTDAALPLDLPDIILPSLAGDSLRLSSYRGRIVLLTFWATWCPPCRADVPGLNQMYADLQDNGIAVIGVTVEKEREDVQTFVEAYGIQYPVAFDAGLLSPILGGVYSLPTSFIVTPDGHVVERITGSRPAGQLRSHLEAIASSMRRTGNFRR